LSSNNDDRSATTENNIEWAICNILSPSDELVLLASVPGQSASIEVALPPKMLDYLDSLHQRDVNASGIAFAGSKNALINGIRNLEPDLVVLGSSFMKSIADNLVRNVNVPVVLVRPSDKLSSCQYTIHDVTSD
jgi:nucleotide-binding universal stress UspA family protein